MLNNIVVVTELMLEAAYALLMPSGIGIGIAVGACIGT